MKKHIEKVKEPEGPALARGRAMEDSVYAFLFGKTKKIPKVPEAGKSFAEELTALRKIAKGVLNNRELAFDRDWQPCRWDDWDRAWVRVKMDLLWASDGAHAFQEPTAKGATVARVADLKSGKIYEDKLDQLDLYKVVALLIPVGVLPAVDLACSQMWYLDQGETRPDGSWSSLMRADLPKELKRWEKRVKPMLLDEAFIPKPGWHCKYCHLSKSKGGPCPY
jgi:hypothetical protein